MRVSDYSKCVLFGCALIAVQPGFAEPAPAQTQQQQTFSFDIPVQDLGSALRDFARASGQQVMFNDKAVQGKRNAPLKGDYTVLAALQHLLNGSGLSVHTGQSGLFVVRDEADASVGSGADQAATSADIESIELVVVTGSALWMGKTGESQREVPQTVTVLSRQRIDDQNLETLTDVMNETTGITVEKSSSLFSNFYSRGFNITNLQLDGGASLDRGIGYGNVLPDMAQFERVEVLRGADGLFSGAGEPGGRVNLVRKRPTAKPQASASVSAGRWNRYEGQLDVAGPLTDSKKLRGRVVTSYANQDSYFDAAEADKALVYGILEADLTSSTTLTVGGSYEDHNLPYFAYGLPRYSTGEDLHLPRSTYLTPEWSYYDSRVKAGFVGLEQAVAGSWMLKVDTHYLSQDEERAGLNFFSPIDRATSVGGAAFPTRTVGDIEQKSVDVAVNGPITLFGREHTIVFGGSWQDAGIASRSQSGAGDAYPMGNIYTFDPFAYPRPAGYDPAAFSFGQAITQSGVYGLLRLHVFTPMHVMLGARYSKFKYESVFADLVNGGSEVTRYTDSGVVTPYGGIVYDLNDSWTAYTSVGETYSSQASSLKGPTPGTPLDPVSGRNYEVGVKGEIGGGAVSTAVALYRIERKGEAVLDDRYDPTFGQLGASCCWLDDGEVVSEGVDAEISSELFHGLTMTAGYTYNVNQDKLQGFGRYHSRTPKHLLKAFGAYRVPGLQNKFRLGGGVTVQSDSYVSGMAFAYDENGVPSATRVPYEFRQGGYALWSVFAEYQITPKVAAALNAANLLDKTYYSTIGTSGYGNWYGEPRNITLTIRAKL